MIDQLPKTSALIGAHVIDLISHAPEILADTSVERVHMPVLLSMMLDHIDRHSDDPELGAATLAARFRCSERYVHRLFATTSRSVGEHVNEKRIVACTRDLLDRNSRSQDHRRNRLYRGLPRHLAFQPPVQALQWYGPAGVSPRNGRALVSLVHSRPRNRAPPSKISSAALE